MTEAKSLMVVWGKNPDIKDANITKLLVLKSADEKKIGEHKGSFFCVDKYGTTAWYPEESFVRRSEDDGVEILCKWIQKWSQKMMNLD